MRVAMALARSGARRRLRALLAVALVIALGLGMSLAAFEAARRTERAFPAYLRDADVGDLVINPSLSTARAEEIIADLPGVESYASDDLLVGTIDDGAPRPQSIVDSVTVQVRVSKDERYVRQDRPAIHDGRMIVSGDEAFLSVEAAEALDVGVGDEIPIAFWAGSFITGTPPPSEVVEPLGRERATVVGVGVFSDEVLVDELYPRQRVLVTPELAAPYTCTFGPLREDDPRPGNEVLAESVPSTCSMAYRYFSLDLTDGDADVGAVTDALLDRFNEENARLPAGVAEADEGYFVIPAATRDERAQVERSLRPAVTALRLFGLAMATATVVVGLLSAARGARRDQDDAVSWRALGVTRGQRAIAVGAPLALAAAAGLVVAWAVGWTASGLGPVASARAVDRGGARGLSFGTASAVLAAAGGVLLVSVALVAAAASRVRAAGSRRARPIGARIAGITSRPSRSLGVRAAVVSSGAGAVLAGSIAAVAVVLGTSVFSTSLGGLVDEPERYGWPYDAAILVGYGYGGLDLDAMERTLDRDEVDRWGVASLGSLVIEGDTVPSISSSDGFDSIPLPVLDGALPTADDEIALGADTADQLGFDVGDEIEIASDYGERVGTVSGIVVLPVLGPYESDRTGPGTGALLSGGFFDALIAQAEAGAGVPPGTFRESLDGFVAIDLRDGVDPARFVAGIEAELPGWEMFGFTPFPHPDAVRPPQIADVAAMRRVPIALGAVFALAMAVGLALGINAATRARRRELALLRALGCSSRQVAASVTWHTATVLVVALVIGGGVGVAAGRLVYRSFARDLGVVVTPLVSLPWTVGVVLATGAIGLAASIGPARRAAGEPAAAVLRNE